MKRTLLVMAGILVGIVIGFLLRPLIVPSEERFLNVLIDTVSWGAEIQGFDEVVEALEELKADPERLDRMMRFMEENPMPDCTSCPELEEWEKRFDEAQGIEPEQ